MGERRAKREAFFREHPNCCFCGGYKEATTEDHQPARTLFTGRVWPEGFVFPACEQCNDVSRESEKVISLLIHGDAKNSDRSKYQSLVKSLRYDYPGMIEGMIPSSSNEIRGILRDKGLERPKGHNLRSVPLVKLDKEFWGYHFGVFSRKILLAMHYQCFGNALKPAGAIFHWTHTNVDFMSGNFPDQIIELASNLALPRRQKEVLADQFAVRWNVVPEHETALFSLAFHRRLVVTGITTQTPEDFDLNFKDDMAKPWSWS